MTYVMAFRETVSFVLHESKNPEAPNVLSTDKTSSIVWRMFVIYNQHLHTFAHTQFTEEWRVSIGGYNK